MGVRVGSLKWYSPSVSCIFVASWQTIFSYFTEQQTSPTSLSSFHSLFQLEILRNDYVFCLAFFSVDKHVVRVFISRGTGLAYHSRLSVSRCLLSVKPIYVRFAEPRMMMDVGIDVRSFRFCFEGVFFYCLCSCRHEYLVFPYSCGWTSFS